MLGVDHHPLLGLELGRQDVGPEEATGARVVRGGLRQDGRRALRHIGIRVDLAVRVVQRDADLLPAVLEAEDLLDLGHGTQLGACGRPRRR